MVKNKKLSKSSVAIIVLALLLIASLVMGMTGAWFTSRPGEKATGDLRFGIIDLDVGVAENTNGWTLTKDDEDHQYLSTTDLMPGDTVNGDFTLNNMGDPAYVFMVYGGKVVREFDKVKAILAEEDVEDALEAAAIEELEEPAEGTKADAWEAMSEVAQANAIDAILEDDAIEALEEPAEGTKADAWDALSAEEQAAAIEAAREARVAAALALLTAENTEARRTQNLFELLAHDVTVPMFGWDNFADYDERTTENEEEVADGYVRYNGADVLYTILKRADNSAVTDTKEVEFEVVLNGAVFDDTYQGAKIAFYVEFVAVQAANLTAEQAVAIAFDNLDTRQAVALAQNEEIGG